MRIACVQCDVAFNQPLVNAERAIENLRHLKSEGVDLVVFPEAFLTGYCVECMDDARQIGLADTAALDKLQQACEELDILCAFGYAERVGEVVYNTAALLEPGQAPRFYRKSHLPELGLDKFVEAGGELPVYETRLGKIGMLFCFDIRIPEAARVLMLKGAELILLPTNWPNGAQISSEHFTIVRAAENRVFLAACNRVGTENGFTFIGGSKIVAPSGKVLAAGGTGEEVLTADMDLAEARIKRTVTIPGKHETTVLQARNPKLYSQVVAEP